MHEDGGSSGRKVGDLRAAASGGQGREVAPDVEREKQRHSRGRRYDESVARVAHVQAKTNPEASQRIHGMGTFHSSIVFVP